MKKIFLILLIIGVVASVLFFTKEREITPEVVIDQTKTMCFARSAQATAEAPYAVEEKITLRIDGATVTGEKSGTQAGPDMTNGYTGTLSGTHVGSIITVRYDYTVEGAKQSEEEEYILGDKVLVKLRYPLIEKGKVLVPDKTKEPTEQEYKEIDCS